MLGVVIGYHKPVADTVNRRQKAAEYAFSRLKPVLGNSRVLPIKQRLEVYDACVGSTLLYAFLAAGPGKAELLRYTCCYDAPLTFHGSLAQTYHTRKTRLGRQLPLVRLMEPGRRSNSFQDISWHTPPYPSLDIPVKQDSPWTTGASSGAAVEMPSLPQILRIIPCS